MSWLEAATDEVSAIERLISTLINLDTVVADALWRRRARTILKRLRVLYWYEGGALRLLREIAAGETPRPERLERARAGFFVTDEAVSEAVAELARLVRSKDLRLKFEDFELLDGIIHDKTAIREAARGLIEAAAASGGPSDAVREDAAALVERILRLNDAFKTADARFRDGS